MDNKRVIGLDWRWWALIAWICFAATLISMKWNAIHWFALGDTDDNMRIMQVRALLHGQGWFDLRQYRLNPPVGFDIHWTRLVDLPIAGLILATRPFVGGAMAEKIAVTGAPLLALGLGIFATMIAVRRLINDHAALLGVAILACANVTLGMWTPLRIDHHGWQLAFLMMMLAGSADRDPLRGGITTGLASALSLVIGLEMLPYLALCGIMTTLAWVRDANAAIRLRGYGLSLAGGVALGFAVFASNANRGYVCDVLSPVYLSTMLVAGASLVGLSLIPLNRRGARLGVAMLAGLAIAAAFAIVWPECLGRPERISPELQQLWFQYINEAKPMWSHGYKRYVPVFAIAVVGSVGNLLALWQNRREERVMAWATAAALSVTATGLLFWQTRAGPSAQLFAVPGAAWLGYHIGQRTLGHRVMLVRVLGTVAVFFVVSGLAASYTARLIPEPKQSKARKAVNLANRRCPTLPSLAPIAKLPAATILTMVDLGPRLITVTHHSAIAGPYHRNGASILDVQHAFRAVSPDVAHDVMKRHSATLLLLCPGMSETTLYSTQDKRGFYVQLVDGKIPAWLEPVELPKKSPFKLWRRID